MASPSPAVTQSQGSAGIVVTFPDGFSANIATVGSVNTSATGNTLLIQNQGAVFFTYYCYNRQEMVLFLSYINNAVSVGVPKLALTSLAPIPTNGDSTNTDMFQDGQAIAGASPVSIAGKTQILLTIGQEGVDWPPPNFPPTGIDVNASFRSDAKVTINGRNCYNITYINAITLQMRCPPNPAGTYDLVYSDSRGTVTKPAAITYA